MYDFLIILTVVIFILVILGVLYSRKFFWVTSKNTPVLFQYYIQKGIFLSLKKIKGKDYDMYTYKSFNFGRNNLNATILLVHLNFKTKLHLVALSNNQPTKNLKIEGTDSLIEEVKLEGDYNEYFKLYTEKGSQSQARYIIDPTAMAFTADFCKSHSWEINDSSFYFVWDNFNNTPTEKSIIFENVEKFIEEIKPALIVPLTQLEIQQRKSYGSANSNKEDISCPICNKMLVETSDEVYECTSHHGILLHASDLPLLRDRKLNLEYSNFSISDNLQTRIDCPSCKNPMQKVNYAMSKEIIDACRICHFRWIDSGELTSN